MEKKGRGNQLSWGFRVGREREASKKIEYATTHRRIWIREKGRDLRGREKGGKGKSGARANQGER